MRYNTSDHFKSKTDEDKDQKGYYTQLLLGSKILLCANLLLIKD